MDWCDSNGVEYLFGLLGNTVLNRLIDEAAGDIRTRRAPEKTSCLRGLAETGYRAKSWTKQRRLCVRIEAMAQGVDIHCVGTSLVDESAEHVQRCSTALAAKPKT